MTPDDPVDPTIDLTPDGEGAAPVGRVNGYERLAANPPEPSTDRTAPASPRSDGYDELAGVQWYTSYDRASVEGYLETLARERDQLRAEIEGYERRAAEAQTTLAARRAELEAGLGAVVLAARAELDRIEQEQREAVLAIRAEAEAEAARIREAARVKTESVRTTMGSLAALAREGDHDVPSAPPAAGHPDDGVAGERFDAG